MLGSPQKPNVPNFLRVAWLKSPDLKVVQSKTANPRFTPNLPTTNLSRSSIPQLVPGKGPVTARCGQSIGGVAASVCDRWPDDCYWPLPTPPHPIPQIMLSAVIHWVSASVRYKAILQFSERSLIDASTRPSSRFVLTFLQRRFRADLALLYLEKFMFVCVCVCGEPLPLCQRRLLMKERAGEKKRK